MGASPSTWGRDFELTLTDRSPEMQEVSRAVNPEAEHLVGDLRTLDLGRQFDRVLRHDAVMYLLTETELAQDSRPAGVTAVPRAGWSLGALAARRVYRSSCASRVAPRSV